MSDVTPVRDFCSLNARSLGADPLGTAPTYDEFIMVEFDLPWARNVVDSSGFPKGVAAAVSEAKAQGRRVQLHAFAPHERYSQRGWRRVMYFRSETEQSPTDEQGSVQYTNVPYKAVEYVAPDDDVEALVRFLLLGDGDAVRLGTLRTEREDVRDLFVCTHGVRDACCGKFGAALQLELDDLVQKMDSGTGKLRVWRVNHLGGHRFAPTLLDLPTARYWGALDSHGLQLLLESPAQLESLRPYYRGWSALHSSEEQVAEGEAWRRIGPGWLTYDKTIRTHRAGALTPDGSHEQEVSSGTSGVPNPTAGSPTMGSVAPVEVTIEWLDPTSGERGLIEVDVDVGHVLTLPESCGKEGVQSRQYVVSRYREVDVRR